MEVKNQPGLFALANADRLRRRILKAALGDFYNVVFGLEIRQAQLAGLSELPLQSSVEKNSCIVLTGKDQQRAHVVTGGGWRRIVCYFSGASVRRGGSVG